ncbi:alkaline phosphatase-like protein [Hypoxylon crocopeplum]|nr:alkaline phosphatase-like protein [Hypoxylon crocopeplum]
MVRLRQNLLLLTANMSLAYGVFIFMTGYFRTLPRMPAPAAVKTSEEARVNIESAPFDKIIFMMIDALRSDFVYTEKTGFGFMQSLIRSGAAIPFTALAASPTLTISRIKALTQGTGQSFLDAWLNIANSDDARRLEGEDTWLSRLKTERDVEKKMLFYGIDVWHVLYPDIFDRYEAIDSFYVPDFTSVDRNVTRHVPDELETDDWKALILHYLGLDNLAHHSGPSGSLMVPKQAEMDDVIRQIYEAMERQSHLENTLFVLAGDHGMTEDGNHGGDTPSEIASALVFISPRLKSISKGFESPLKATENFEYYSVINQIDIVPTLAGLLGFSVPAHSVGVFISELLALFQTENDRLAVLLENSKQMMSIFKARYDTTSVDIASCGHDCEDCQDAESEIMCLWEKIAHEEQQWRSSQDAGSEKLIRIIRKFCTSAQQSLSIPLSNLSFPRLLLGVACMVTAVALLIWNYSLSQAPWDSGILIFGAVAALHAATMFKSQLVQEEHHYWYFVSLLCLSYLGCRRLRKGDSWAVSLSPVILQLISQCLNPQYAVTGFIKAFLFKTPIFLWGLGSITYISALRTGSDYLGMGPVMSLVVSLSLCGAGIVFKLGSTNRVNPELLSFTPSWVENLMGDIDYEYSLKVLWTGLAASFIFVLLQFKFSGRVSEGVTMIGIVELANLYLRSLTRPQNLVLYQIYDLQLRWLLSPMTRLSISEIAVTALILGQSSFYASGRNNSVASIDLMNGFNGVAESNIVAVFVQTLMSNWLGPIWWSLASLRMLLTWLETQNVPANKLQSKTVSSSTLSSSHGTSHPDQKSHLDKNVVRNGVAVGPKPNGQSGTPVSQKTESRRPLFEFLSFQTLYMAVSSLAVMAACLWQRNDPRLWTVLAPKYVNVALWAVFYHVLMTATLGTGIWYLIVG